ncbi:unnamed protein product, partial [Brassica rapa]
LRELQGHFSKSPSNTLNIPLHFQVFFLISASTSLALRFLIRG